jgi:hypothetical protein
MSYYIRPVPPVDYTDAWGSNVGQTLNNSQLRGGAGIVIKKGANGTHISLVNDLSDVALNYAGVYNFSQSYQPNDIVYVDPLQTYYDQNNAVIPICSGSSASGLPAICAGLFVCVQYVPAYGVDYNMLVTYVEPSYTGSGQAITGEMADTYRQYSYNVYWPVYPLIPSSSLTSVSQGSWQITANQNFWAPLSPMFRSETCQADGTFQGAFVNGVISGSVFDLTQLPYTG